MASKPVPYASTQMDDEDDRYLVQMDDGQLTSILQAHELQAIGYMPGSDDEISTQQRKAINYYYGIMDDVPATEGCSSVVDTTVQVVVDNALASILKPFVSADETVKFTPRGKEDIPLAEQATEYVNYVFNMDNPGFKILHDWIKDGLLTKVGTIKVWWEPQRKVVNQRQIEIQDDMHAAYLRQQPDYMGEENGVAFHGSEVDDGKLVIANIPPEEFRISPLSRDFETALYMAHVPANCLRSDLIEMGFDEDVIEALPAYTESWSGNTVRVSRYQDERIGDQRIDAPHHSQDRIALRDEYVRIDYDGDGVAELRRIMRVGDVILLNEPVEMGPFAGWCPLPMSHKVYGHSLADLSIEIQKINTVLWRQQLDNLYKSNNPRPVIAQNGIMDDGSTAESLMDNAPGAAIFVKTLDGFTFEAVPYTADKSSQMMSMTAQMVEMRTGVGLTGQGLDANALKKAGQTTATEMAMIQSGKNSRIEMMARVFAEMGLKHAFRIILHLLQKHQCQEKIIRLRNQWVPVDPRSWPEMDLEVSVGLGMGDKIEQMAQADSVLQTMEILGASPYSFLLDPSKVYNAVKRKFVAAGIKNTDEFLVEPTPEVLQQHAQSQQQQPDPAMMKAQADIQIKQIQAQHAQEMAQLKLHTDAMAAQNDNAMKAQQAQWQMQIEAVKADHGLQLAQQEQALEAALAAHKMHLEQQMAEHKQSMLEKQTDATIAQRPDIKKADE